MPPVQAHTITHTLDTVIANFRQWRAHRIQRGRVPPELMEQAAALVGHYPLSKISTSLGLDFDGFKRYCRQRDGLPSRSTRSTRSKLPSPAFVEVQTLPPAFGFDSGNPAAIHMELRRGDGATLQIHCTEPAALRHCIEQFLQG
jgi:hypothetical protein